MIVILKEIRKVVFRVPIETKVSPTDLTGEGTPEN